MWGRLELLPYSVLGLLFASTYHNPTNAANGFAVEPRSLTTFSDPDIVSLGTSPNPNLDPYDPRSHLYKILIPRAPDTANNTFVRNHIANTLRNLNWHVEEDEFTDSTPYGTKKFTNIIATKDPDAPRRIIMAAHFDSKFFPTAPMNQFLGATDSAAPCAMLLDLAEALNPMLEARMTRIENGTADDEEEELAHSTLQLVFFDGEEAFNNWTAMDSIYGARHLADKWSTEFTSSIQARKLNRVMTKIDTIEHLVLLDLLGAEKPLVQSFFPSTAWLYDGMAAAEHRLGLLGLFDELDISDADEGKWRPWNGFFMPRTSYEHQVGRIEDDHIPFMRLGVPILHIIATPFPRVWHTLQDDASALHIPTMKRWNLIFRVFAAEYLKLRPLSSGGANSAGSAAGVKREAAELVN